jgi:hypothetical protein
VHEQNDQIAHRRIVAGRGTREIMRELTIRQPHLALECWSQTTPGSRGFANWLVAPPWALGRMRRQAMQSRRISPKTESLCWLLHVAAPTILSRAVVRGTALSSCRHAPALTLRPLFHEWPDVALRAISMPIQSPSPQTAIMTIAIATFVRMLVEDSCS